jgi:hypothetical protein
MSNFAFAGIATSILTEFDLYAWVFDVVLSEPPFDGVAGEGFSLVARCPFTGPLALGLGLALLPLK